MSDVEEELFLKYDLIDDEGYLVGTSDPKIIAVFERIEALSKKENLTNSEIEEGEELIAVQKAYTKAAQEHLLLEAMENESYESDDSSFVVDSDDSDDSDDYSYDSHRESGCSESSEYD